jgi:putative colanic acid biosynthesis UDP-glucose lipid carrier transferase
MKVIKTDDLLNGHPLCNRVNRIIKRSLDVAFSLPVVVFILPPAYLIIGIAIKLMMPGPIIFSQKRTGRKGKTFVCYKFRTMVPNYESELVQAHDKDLRITPLGYFLRRTSLDELPQFWNVLRGDMSVVGPRPHMIAHTNLYSPVIPHYNRRLEVKPGITGWAQVHNLRGETYNSEKMHKRVKYDLWYIKNWSLRLDARTVWHTAGLLFSDLMTFTRERRFHRRRFSPQFQNEKVRQCTV